MPGSRDGEDHQVKVSYGQESERSGEFPVGALKSMNKSKLRVSEGAIRQHDSFVAHFASARTRPFQCDHTNHRIPASSSTMITTSNL